MSALQVIHREFANEQVEFLQDPDGELLMTNEQLGVALGFAGDDPGKGVRKVFERNMEELLPHRVRVNLTRDGVTREVTCWRKAAIYAFGFLARTDRAREFRVWAAQVMDDIETGSKVVMARETFDAVVNLTTAQGRMLGDYGSMFGRLLAMHGHTKRQHPELFGKRTPQQFLGFYEAELLEDAHDGGAA